jgi:hypothetical protein
MQLTIYIDDDASLRAKASAAASKMSLSGWVTKLIKEHAQPVDKQGYPLGFFEAMQARAGAGVWDDFPSIDDIRASEVPDLPREAF